jgi:hypothetical protein
MLKLISIPISQGDHFDRLVIIWSVPALLPPSSAIKGFIHPYSRKAAGIIYVGPIECGFLPVLTFTSLELDPARTILECSV